MRGQRDATHLSSSVSGHIEKAARSSPTLMSFFKMVSTVKKRTNSLRILVLGLDNAGKSTIISQYRRAKKVFKAETGKDVATDHREDDCKPDGDGWTGEEDEIIEPPTFGYRIYTHRDGEYSVTFVELGGQTVFQKYQSNYFEGTDAVAYVVDSTDDRPIEKQLEAVYGLRLPTAVFWNKADLIGWEQSEYWNGVDEENSRCVRCFKVSATQNRGVSEGFQWLLRAASKYRNESGAASHGSE